MRQRSLIEIHQQVMLFCFDATWSGLWDLSSVERFYSLNQYQISKIKLRKDCVFEVHKPGNWRPWTGLTLYVLSMFVMLYYNSDWCLRLYYCQRSGECSRNSLKHLCNHWVLKVIYGQLFSFLAPYTSNCLSLRRWYVPRTNTLRTVALYCALLLYFKFRIPAPRSFLSPTEPEASARTSGLCQYRAIF